jgi:3-phenylpropionate/trans-cinnamate dioxygenase ferredoxin reductase subunit
MPASAPIVIVGASLTGAKAAESLRTEGFEGPITLIGEDPERPYERPPLSKEYLQGKSEREKVFVHADGFYREQDIELRAGTTVSSIDPVRHEVVVEDGERFPYAQLLVATGSSPRRLAVPGADLDGVLYLRTLADCDALADALEHSDSLVVIGAGWIGSEVAASARQLGVSVTMIDPADLPLQHVLGDEVGAIYRDLHRSHGVDLRLDVGVDSLRGGDRVDEVDLTDGTRIPAEVVVVGVGALPRVELAAAAGLTVDNGIVVDANLQANLPDVFAAGDVASAFHPLYHTHLRVEHWANALNQGLAVGKNLAGVPTPYDRVPYFYSDQYDLSMEYSGYATTWDRVVFRGNPDDGEFVAFWMKGRRVLAGMNANVWDVLDPIQHLIRERIEVDDASLADTDIPLGSLG